MNTKIVIFWIEKTMEEKLHRKKLGPKCALIQTNFCHVDEKYQGHAR